MFQNTVKIATRIICLMFCLVGFTAWIFGDKIQRGGFCCEDLKFCYTKHFIQAKYAYFLGPRPKYNHNVSDIIPIFAEMRSADHVVTGIFIVQLYFRNMIGAYYDCVHLVVSISLFMAAKGVSSTSLHKATYTYIYIYTDDSIIYIGLGGRCCLESGF